MTLVITVFIIMAVLFIALMIVPTIFYFLRETYLDTTGLIADFFIVLHETLNNKRGGK